MVTIPVLMASDDKYVPFLATCVASILHNSGSEDHLSLYILEFTGDLSPESKQKLEMLKKIRPFDLEYITVEKELVKDFYESPHTLNTYLRMFIPDRLNSLDKIIYLDCDVIVRKPLAELYFTGMAESVLGAVLDAAVVLDDKEICRYQRQYNSAYFNAGVLLMNLKKMREIDFTGAMTRWLVERDYLQFPDQDALNALYKDCHIQLPLTYNAQFPMLASMGTLIPENHKYYQELLDPVIVHFTTGNKPWFYLADPPYKQEFCDYLAMTPWADYTPPDKSLPNQVKRFVKKLAGR